MNHLSLTITGNLTDDPELRFTPGGQPVASFRVASTERYLDRRTGEWKDSGTTFLRCEAWGNLAENIAESLHRGSRVIVSGRLRQRNYETKDGDKRTVYEVTADDCGPSLRTATADIRKAERVTAAAGPGGDEDQDHGYNGEPPF